MRLGSTPIRAAGRKDLERGKRSEAGPNRAKIHNSDLNYIKVDALTHKWDLEVLQEGGPLLGLQEGLFA